MNKISQLPTIFPLMILFGLFGPAQAADLEIQTNREGPATVKVIPKNISPGSKSWDFEVTLSTHTVPLDQDMTRAAVLIAGSGKPQAPMSWEGDPPGGHHRKGVLRFQPPSAMPRQIELQINGIGDVNKRVFRWPLSK